MADLSRRVLLGVLGAAACGAGVAARGRDAAVVAWPGDVPGWDPMRRFAPEAQPLYRAVFDAPLERDSRLAPAPGVVRRWQLAGDARSLALELREDVRFHDGTLMTPADLRWSLLGRRLAGQGGAVGDAWGFLEAVETPGAGRAVLRFDRPMPGAVARLAFLGGFVLPLAAGLSARPVGSGPYRVVEHRAGVRIVLERHDGYWGPRPALRRITVEILRDSAARVAAVAAGRVDLAVALPVREVQRLGAVPGLARGLAGELAPVARVVLLRVRAAGGFADRRVRLAAHHAIDKRALSQAFLGGAAAALSVPAVPGGAGHLEDFTFPHDLGIALRLMEEAGHGPAAPVRIRLAAPRGQFAGDHDMARAIVAMWGRVGIAAVLVPEGGGAEAELCCLDDGGGDPEVLAGYWLDPSGDMGPDAVAPETVSDEAARLRGWRALGRAAVEDGAVMPLLQGVQTLVRRQALAYRPYGNGWVLPQTMDWVAAG